MYITSSQHQQKRGYGILLLCAQYSIMDLWTRIWGRYHVPQNVFLVWSYFSCAVLCAILFVCFAFFPFFSLFLKSYFLHYYYTCAAFTRIKIYIRYVYRLRNRVRGGSGRGRGLGRCVSQVCGSESDDRPFISRSLTLTLTLTACLWDSTEGTVLCGAVHYSVHCTVTSRRSQHSQECKDPRRQCFCDYTNDFDLWPPNI